MKILFSERKKSKNQTGLEPINRETKTRNKVTRDTPKAVPELGDTVSLQDLPSRPLGVGRHGLMASLCQVLRRAVPTDPLGGSSGALKPVSWPHPRWLHLNSHT